MKTNKSCLLGSNLTTRQLGKLDNLENFSGYQRLSNFQTFFVLIPRLKTHWMWSYFEKLEKQKVTFSLSQSLNLSVTHSVEQLLFSYLCSKVTLSLVPIITYWNMNPKTPDSSLLLLDHLVPIITSWNMLLLEHLVPIITSWSLANDNITKFQFSS